MNKEIVHQIRLGIFVVTGVIMFIVGLYLIGNNQNMFGSTFRINTVFREVNGLQEGNNVRYSGINVGTVDRIRLQNDTSIIVELVLDENMKAFIRTNSIASVGTDGLMGNKLVNISPGSPNAPLVNEGGAIPSEESVDTETMLRTLEFTNRNIGFVSANLKDITENINRSKGTLYTVLMDTTLASKFHRTIDHIESASHNLTSITNDLSSITKDVKSGKGMVGKLLNDSSMTNDLQTILAQVKQSSEQFASFTTDLGQISGTIHSGKGTISMLLNDTLVSKSWKQSILNIETSSKKLDEDLEALKHNILFRGYFNKQEKLKKKQGEK